MKLWLLFVPAVVAFGCGTDKGNAPVDNAPSAEQKLGQLSLELLGADRAGHPYRLRNATFQIDSSYLYYPVDGGGVSETVSSETDPDATAITTRLIPGSYTVTLENGWFLEKVIGAQGERVEQSILLSPSTVYAYVYDHGIAEVRYSFGVDGTLIDFRHGDLSIGFGVEHPDDVVGDAGVQGDGG